MLVVSDVACNKYIPRRAQHNTISIATGRQQSLHCRKLLQLGVHSYGQGRSSSPLARTNQAHATTLGRRDIAAAHAQAQALRWGHQKICRSHLVIAHQAAGSLNLQISEISHQS